MAPAAAIEPRAATAAGIRVCARFRPQNKLELKQQAVECVFIDDTSGDSDDASGRVQVQSANKSEKLTFTFDQVFGTASTQREVYDATAKPLVESALRGYNCTCFVYGQTGTGKTFSMEGVPGDTEFAGIIPRVMADVFDGIDNMQTELEFLVRVSYIEIYLEKIRDLLQPASNNLSVRESRERGVWVAGATEVCCASADEMLRVMRLGGTNRVIASTRMNNDSSRSHSVFIITIEQRNSTTGSTRSGKLFLVDLAGSEKIGKTLAKGQTLKEAQHINKSLSALGSVMNALTSGAANAHVPYRDSKLTRLLQDSLGGNSQTTLLVCGSCSSYNSDETITTLRFGTRAKSIKNKPKVNEEKTVAEFKVLLADRDRQIAALTKTLQQHQATPAADSADNGDSDAQAPATVETEAQRERLAALLLKIEQLEDEQATRAVEVTSLEERCAELELQTTALAQRELQAADAATQRDELIHSVAFLERELAAKADECTALSALLAMRKAKDTSRCVTLPPAAIAENDALVVAEDEGATAAIADSDTATRSSDATEAKRTRVDSTALLDNELLQQQLSARATELSISTQRIAQLTTELANCRLFYEQQVDALEQRLRDYDAHIRGLEDVAVHGDKATKTLRSVRGGGGGTAPTTAPTTPLPTDVAALATPLQRARIVSSVATLSPDGWQPDDEVFPIAPIDMESPVVQRLIANMPERGRAKMAKWLGFVLEGRDIRSRAFHPELAIEGINETLNRDMRALIVPLLKNRRDLDVQSFIRTRFVRVTDLKITLAHRNNNNYNQEETVDVGATSDDDVSSMSRVEATAATGATTVDREARQFAHDHVFYGPKTDAASASVLHTMRTLSPTKDKFTSDPVDLSASVQESKSILDMHAPPTSRTNSTSSSSSNVTAAAASSTPSSSSSSSSSSGGGMFGFGRLRAKTGVSHMLGDVKSLWTARYHKRFVHDDTLCDSCGASPIVGRRWQCSRCATFDLCDACYGAGVHGFEVSNAMCRRIEAAAVAKHRVLGDSPELFELVRRHICNDDTLQFRRVVEWLVDVVAGADVATIHRRVIVKRGLHPEIRARLVAQLGSLVSERQDIVLKTEWIAEVQTEEEEDEEEDEVETEDSEDSARPVEQRSVSTDSNHSSQSVAPASSSSSPPRVQLETLRLFVIDATIEETVESVRKHSYADLLLLDPAPATATASASGAMHRSASTASSTSTTTASDHATAVLVDANV